jgi:hypothetical protein
LFSFGLALTFSSQTIKRADRLGRFAIRRWTSGTTGSFARATHKIISAEDLEPAVVMFRDRRAALHEIAGVHIEHPIDLPDRGVMDMSADDANDPAPRGFGGERRMRMRPDLSLPFVDLPILATR